MIKKVCILKKMKKEIGDLISRTAIYFAENSVGKSSPFFSYEVKIPEQLKEKEKVDKNKKCAIEK